MPSGMIAGFTTVALELPHRTAPVECRVPTLKESAGLLRLFDQTRASDTALADLLEAFPAAVGLSAETFDGLTPAEFVAVVGRFFSVRRDQPAHAVTEPPSASSPSSSIASS